MATSILFDTKAAGVYLGGPNSPISPRTLERWRKEGQGPRFLKVGHAVRYAQVDLDQFKENCERAMRGIG